MEIPSYDTEPANAQVYLFLVNPRHKLRTEVTLLHDGEEQERLNLL
jgi:hypothetical protein